jgi:hypothetical protein
MNLTSIQLRLGAAGLPGVHWAVAILHLGSNIQNPNDI